MQDVPAEAAQLLVAVEGLTASNTKGAPTSSIPETSTGNLPTVADVDPGNKVDTDSHAVEQEVPPIVEDSAEIAAAISNIPGFVPESAESGNILVGNVAISVPDVVTTAPVIVAEPPLNQASPPASGSGGAAVVTEQPQVGVSAAGAGPSKPQVSASARAKKRELARQFAKVADLANQFLNSHASLQQLVSETVGGESSEEEES